MNKHKARFSWPFLLLTCGVLVRLIPYFYRRSLWLDEANLANGILESSYTALLGVLPYNQAAPIGFLWLVKSSTLIFGESEYALRLVPLLASLLSLWLFYQLVQRVFSTPFAWWALAFFAFCPPLVYYASELKQYGLDVCCGLWLMCCTMALFEKLDNPKSIFQYAISGGVLLWFSQPLVFILAGSWLALLFHHGFAKSKLLIFPAILWAISFGLYFFGFLKLSIGDDQLQNYHLQYFLPLAFWEIESWQWLINTCLKVFRNPGGFFFNYLAILVAGLGLVFGFRKQKHLLLMFLLPVLLTLVVSGFHFYSTIPRLMLFIVPALLIFVVKGLETASLFAKEKWTAPWLSYAVFAYAALLLLQPFLTTAIHNMKGIEIEEIKTPIQFIVDHQETGDQLYLYEFAQPAFRYYQNQFPLQQLSPLKASPIYKNWKKDFEGLQKGDRVWLLFSHYKDEKGKLIDQKYLAFLDEYGQQLLQKKAEGSVCYLYEWKR